MRPQVHRARLRSSGKDVAVKLQYPGLESAIAADIATFAALTHLVSFVYRDLQIVWVVTDLRAQVGQEIDFRMVWPCQPVTDSLCWGHGSQSHPRTDAGSTNCCNAHHSGWQGSFALHWPTWPKL